MKDVEKKKMTKLLICQKKAVALGALVVLVGVAGYLNFVYDKSDGTQSTLNAVSYTHLDSIRLYYSDKKMLLIDYEVDGVKHKNHYLCGLPPFSPEHYRKWYGMLEID